MKAKKGVSPLLSAVMLILLTLSLAVIILPWALDMATKTTNETSTTIEQKVFCQKLAYDFVTDYGNSGIIYNFTGTNGTIRIKIVNTGTVNIYGFDIELTFTKNDGMEVIRTYPDVVITAESQRSSTSPLRPGREWILVADVYNINDTWSLIKTKVLNSVCPSVTVTLET